MGVGNMFKLHHPYLIEWEKDLMTLTIQLLKNASHQFDFVKEAILTLSTYQKGSKEQSCLMHTYVVP